MTYVQGREQIYIMWNSSCGTDVTENACKCLIHEFVADFFRPVCYFNYIA